MNRISLGIGGIAVVAALNVLLLSAAAGAAAGPSSIGKNGVIYSCFKAKGKNKGSLRVVPSKRSCRKMRGWRPLSWSASSSSGASGLAGSEGSRGQQGSPGPEGKEGPRGVAGQVEKSVLDTIQAQTAQIDTLTEQVSDLSDEVVDLEGTIGKACTQLTTLTDQTDDIVAGVNGVVPNNALQLINGLVTFPNLPLALGTFDCDE